MQKGLRQMYPTLMSPRIAPLTKPTGLHFGAKAMALPAGIIANQAKPNGRYDVFISYHPKDQAQAKKIADNLGREGISVVMRNAEDKSTLKGSGFSPDSLEWLLENSQKTIALLSPESTKDETTKQEQSTSLHIGFSTREYRLLPVILRECTPSILIQSLMPVDWQETGAMDVLIRAITGRKAKRLPVPFPGSNCPEASLPAPTAPTVPGFDALNALADKFGL